MQGENGSKSPFLQHGEGNMNLRLLPRAFDPMRPQGGCRDSGGERALLESG